MTCEEFRTRFWTELDGGEPASETAAHSASCPECGEYAAKARRLHTLLPEALETAPAPSIEPAVMERIREEREWPAPAGAWIPAGVLLPLGLAYAAVGWAGWDAVAPYLFLPDVTAARDALERALAFDTRSVPMTQLAPTFVIAVVLWISTQWNLLKEQGRKDHG